ncbi:glycosyl transferase [Acidovorax lacteus]|uniref:Glycosyltransferase family 2 protein n=1 Tax=Acidovorax lacteus TaxID=1924988 RepID=A0ABP8L017_9BURK
MPDRGALPRVAVSIVSHGHAHDVSALVAALASSSLPPHRIWVTWNHPAESADLASAARVTQAWHAGALQAAQVLRHRHNKVPQGFGANHNAAFACEQAQPDPADWFVVLNPDVRWLADPWGGIGNSLRAAEPAAAAWYVRQVSACGQPQDAERALPTPQALLRRYVGPRAAASAVPARIDWVNAAFLVLSSAAYRAVGGFDERYFMYCEDVDLCLRLQLRGYALQAVPGALVIHAGQRASHRRLDHLRWHLQSLWRLWRSDAYRQFRALRRGAPVGAR